jgi:hypothetical protein
MMRGAIAIALACAAGGAWAQATLQGTPQGALPRLQTNEAEIDSAIRATSLAIDDPVAVFAFVLGQLPERVKVYPTENFYYFRFTHGGVVYSGNIRLAPGERDRGRVSFAYGEEVTESNSEPEDVYALLGPEQGIAVEKLEPLVYRVTKGGKSVVFALNDLSQVRPPAGMLHADEKFIGPVFDESAIRFFLVFNARLKVFHYILDETVPVADRFIVPDAKVPIRIGKRTGFAFYRHGGREILIGVSERQSWLNTVFDGPFDQVPENFIEGEALRAAILAANPRMLGKIDRLGGYSDGSRRYAIRPFLPYRSEQDLAVVHRCVTSRRVAAADRARCFVFDSREARRPNPRPLPLLRR